MIALSELGWSGNAGFSGSQAAAVSAEEDDDDGDEDDDAAAEVKLGFIEYDGGEDGITIVGSSGAFANEFCETKIAVEN